ncbi:MAG TPA: metal-dependent hydrolase [Pseudogracilibacillus sp.]|nr:metal-dependent hydrolase [Pseudogracilibacillus sp.]
MTGKTHIVGGTASCVAVAAITSYDPVPLITAGAVGGLLPDICHRGSTIGRKVPLLSILVSKIFGHRTFTHSLLFLALIGIALEVFSPYEAVNIGILVGMASHFVLDAVTKDGIKLLYPWSVTVRFPVTTKTGGVIEYGVFAVLAIITVVYAKDIFI